MEGKSDEENMKQKILGRKKMINTTKNKNCRKNRKSCGRFEKKRVDVEGVLLLSAEKNKSRPAFASKPLIYYQIRTRHSQTFSRF